MVIIQCRARKKISLSSKKVDESDIRDDRDVKKFNDEYILTF